MPKKKTNDQDLIFNNKKETEMKSKKPINKIDPYDREMNFMIDQEFHKLINDLLSKNCHPATVVYRGTHKLTEFSYLATKGDTPSAILNQINAICNHLEKRVPKEYQLEDLDCINKDKII